MCLLSSRSDMKVYVTQYYKQLPLLYNLSGNSEHEGISKKCHVPTRTSPRNYNYILHKLDASQKEIVYLNCKVFMQHVMTNTDLNNSYINIYCDTVGIIEMH